MDISTQLIVAIVPGLIIAVFSSFYAARKTLDGFYAQQWWQLKSKSYSDILLALYGMKDYYQTQMYVFQTGSELSEEKKGELNTRLTSGFDEVKKATAIGSFIISNQASEYLDKFVKNYRNVYNAQDWYAEMDEKWGLIDNCITDLREYAKKDLKKKE